MDARTLQAVFTSIERRHGLQIGAKRRAVARPAGFAKRAVATDNPFKPDLSSAYSDQDESLSWWQVTGFCSVVTAIAALIYFYS